MQAHKPYPQVYERMDEWPIYKLSQDHRRFIEEIDEFTLNRLIKEHPKLYNLVAETVYQERIRIKESPWKVDPPNEATFWNRLRSKLVKSESETKTQAKETHEDIIKRIIHRYSTEIVGTFSINTFRFARLFLHNFFNRLLNAAAERWWRFLSSRNRLHERIQVFGETDALRSLMKKGVVVVVPTHFSNIDSILVGFAMDQFVGLPSSSYGAGLNLYNSGAAAFFMNRLGAYRVDRRKKNAIYLETLKSMSMISIVRGTNTLFFPGGTRARSGMVETKLKMGLLGTAIEAQRVLCQQAKEKEAKGNEKEAISNNQSTIINQNSPTKVFIVPLVMSYHFVLEAPFLIQQHLQITGKEKYIAGRSAGNSIREWLRFIWQFFAKKSDIILNFGKPMDILGNFVDADGASFDGRNNPLDINDYFTTEGVITEDLQREAEYTKLLAERIVDRFHRENIVLSSHVVAFTAFNILRSNNEAFDLYALLRLPPDDFVFPIESFVEAIEAVQAALFELEEKGRLKLSDAIRLSAAELVEDGMKNLGVYHARKPLLYNKKGDIESDDFSTLFYYHNRLENFGLTKRVRWQKYKMETRLGEFVKVEG
jgi:glycerol-3-phosphate O-acyltransferase